MNSCPPKKENQMATSDLARDGVWCPQKDTAKSSPQNLREPQVGVGSLQMQSS